MSSWASVVRPARPSRPAAPQRRTPCPAGRRREAGRCSAALELRLALLEEGLHRLGDVGRPEVHRLGPALVLEGLLQRDLEGVVEQPLGLGQGDRAALRPGALAQSSTKASSSPAGTTRFTSPRASASLAEMMSANSASSLARCSPTSRGSSHEPPKSIDRPRRAKISEKRASSEATMRSQPRARLQPAPAGDAADLGDRRLGQAVQRQAHVADVAHGVATGGAARSLGVGAPAAQVGARAERSAGAGEHDHPVVVGRPAISWNVASSSSHIAPLMAFFFSGPVEGDR